VRRILNPLCVGRFNDLCRLLSRKSSSRAKHMAFGSHCFRVSPILGHMGQVCLVSWSALLTFRCLKTTNDSCRQ
jgi:hypothetical protein